MNDILTHKEFLANLYNLIFSILIEEDYIVDVRTVVYKLVFLQRSANESLGAVDI